jgi:hypothetical protein
MQPEEQDLGACIAQIQEMLTNTRGTKPTPSVILHLATPALLARHGAWDAWQQRVELICRTIEPLVNTMALIGGRMVITGGYARATDGTMTLDPVPWLGASGEALVRTPRFWQRPRFLSGTLVHADDFRLQWLAPG